MYCSMEPLLRSLHRNEETMRTRQIKPGENVKSLCETVMGESSEFRFLEIGGDKMSCSTEADIAELPYMFYNQANALEDAILFPDELDSTRPSVAFREIRNGVSDIECHALPSEARYVAKGLAATNKERDPKNDMRLGNEQHDEHIWGLPKVWETGLRQARQEKPTKAQRDLFERNGLLRSHKCLSFKQRLDVSDPEESMDRDRGFSFKESLHAGDLEPGYNVKYEQLQERRRAMLGTAHAGSTDWIWYMAEILDWLEIRGDYDDYSKDPFAPWPHSFIVQDLVQAFAMMAMFFPDLHVTTLVTMFVKSSQCDEFRKSGLFDAKERSKARPDRRTGTSFKFRDKGFWKEWEAFYDNETNSSYADVYPMEWSLTVRPIIAHLYRAGVIALFYAQNNSEIVFGMATANKEPHRPGELDLFISYEDQYGKFPMKIPSTYPHPSKWPQVIPCVQDFSKKHDNARFALLRIWSAPHYYPIMVGQSNRPSTGFLDSLCRSWEWRFVPKDMPGSEYTLHLATSMRLETLQHKFGDRVMGRGDLIVVMGEDADDLLKFCTAVTLAVQTRPWYREVDLWKSFINVDLDFIEGLESYWLD